MHDWRVTENEVATAGVRAHISAASANYPSPTMIETRTVPTTRNGGSLEAFNANGVLQNDDVATLKNGCIEHRPLALILSRCVNAKLLPHMLQELQTCSPLECLKLHNNRNMKMPSEGHLVDLAAAPEKGHDFGSAGAAVLADFLITNTTVKHLVLSDNGIGPGGAVALAQALQVNGTLETLDLREPSIGADGLRAISNAIKTNKTVTSLTIAIGKGFNDAVKSFEEAIRLNSTIKSLSIIRWGQCVDLRKFDQSVYQILKWNVTLLQMNYDCLNTEIARRALDENRNMPKLLGSKMTEEVLPYALSKSNRPAMVYHILRAHVDMAVRGLMY